MFVVSANRHRYSGDWSITSHQMDGCFCRVRYDGTKLLLNAMSRLRVRSFACPEVLGFRVLATIC